MIHTHSEAISMGGSGRGAGCRGPWARKRAGPQGTKTVEGGPPGPQGPWTLRGRVWASPGAQHFVSIQSILNGKFQKVTQGRTALIQGKAGRGSLFPAAEFTPAGRKQPKCPTVGMAGYVGVHPRGSCRGCFGRRKSRLQTTAQPVLRVSVYMLKKKILGGTIPKC